MQKPFYPRVSIIIPVYNGADYLAEAIDSALSQTYKNFEIVIINDGSNDEGATERIAKSYGDRIRYYSKTNGGVASALNAAINYMQGDYFSWLSHDDLYLPNKVSSQVELLSTLPHNERGRTVVYSDFYTFTEPTQIPTLCKLIPPEPKQFRFWITTENRLHGCTLLIPKTAFLEVGYFNEALRTTQDYDMWFRIASTYRFVHIPEPLVKGRIHANQDSLTLSNVARRECNILLKRFTQELSAYELVQVAGTPGRAYARIAASMFRRRFMTAGWRASRSALAAYLFPATQTIKHWLSVNFLAGVRQLISREDSFAAPASVRGLSLKEKFSAVYDNNIFQGRESRSGEGSNLEQTTVIRREIPVLLEKLGVETMVDAPCGDWYWMRHVALPVKHYIGVDIVDDLVAHNQQQYGNEKVSFQTANLATDPLPQSDLIMSRDCLVHLSHADAYNIVANFKRSGATYLLATTFTGCPNNPDLGRRFWRPLNMQLPPFNFPPPLALINEQCTEGKNKFRDKCLGLWRLTDIDAP